MAVQDSSAVQYAGFWARVAAYFVDFAIIMVAYLVLGLAGVFGGPMVAALMGVLTFFLNLLYWPVMEASARQATFGKQVLGLQVTHVDGGRTSFLRALGRHLAKVLSAIPLCLGFVMAAFTGRKQCLHDMVARCVVVQNGPSRFGKAVLVCGLGLAVTVGAGAAFMKYVAMPHLQKELTGGMQDMMKADMKPAPRPSPAPAPSTPPAPAAPPAVAAGPAPDFDALAGAALTGYDKPNTVRAGPAILELSSFFPSSFWLKVHLPQIRGVEAGMPPEITVTRVLDGAGRNYYDPANTFEKDPFFRRARLSPEAKPVPRYEGTRTVNIERGLGESSLSRIEGNLRVFIPAEIRTEGFEAADAGKDRTVHTSTVTLKSLKGADAVLHYRGASANLLGVRGLADGKPVDIESRQLPGDAKTVDMDMTVKFKAPVTRVEVVVAAGVAERSFPFVLTRGGTAGPVPPSASKAAPDNAAAITQVASPAIQDKPAAASGQAVPPSTTAAVPTPRVDPGTTAQEARPRATRKPAAPTETAQSAAAPAPVRAPQVACTFKPVMTDAEIAACRQLKESRPVFVEPPPVAAAPNNPNAAPAARAVATPLRPCEYKPVMSDADRAACGIR